MVRTRWNESVALVVSDFLRVGMWPIIKPNSRTSDPETGIVKNIYRYGSGENSGVVVVHGELIERDRGTFLIISALDKQNGYQGFNGKMSELVKMKGVKNINDPDSIYSIWDSVDSLLDVEVRIRPNKRGGSLSAAFKLVTGYINSDGSFFLTTGDYHRMIENLHLYELRVPLPEYFSSRSPINHSLHLFLKTQKLQEYGKSYEISLKKLCNYIGYAPQGRSWGQIWQHIKPAMDEEKRKGFIGRRSGRDENRCRTEGGIIKFWGPRKQPLEEDTKGQEFVTDRKISSPDDKYYDGMKYSRCRDGYYRSFGGSLWVE